MKRIRDIILIGVCLVPAWLRASNQIAQVHYECATQYHNGRKLAVDGNGNLHACYMDKSGDDYVLYYAYSSNEGGNWTPTLVDDNTGYNHPGEPAIVVEADGTVYIAYFDGSYLRVWKKDGENTSSHGWNVGGGQYPSMIIEEAAEPARGLVYYSKGDFYEGRRIHSQAFNLSDLQTPSGWRDTPTEREYGAQEPFQPSACGGLKGSAGEDVAIGVGWYWTAGVPEEGGNPSPLCRRIDYNWTLTPTTYWGERDFVYTDKWGNSSILSNGHPSVGRVGEEAWALYRAAYRKCKSPDFFFEDPPDGKPYMTGLNGGDHCQIVYDNFPFAVEEYNNKVYYSHYDNYSDCAGPGEWWTSATRITDYSSDTLERFPHTAVDRKNNKVYVMWTQYRDDEEEHDTTVQIDYVSFVGLGIDTILVTKPAGGEEWWTGFYHKIKWTSLVEDTPDYTHIAYSADGAETWRQVLDTTDYSPEEYNWFVGKDKWGHIYGEDGDEKKSENCYVKVTLVWLDPNGADYDISGRFTIVPMLFRGRELPYITSYGGKGYDPQNPTEGGSLMSMEEGDNNPWDVNANGRILGYIEPNDTFDIPWEGYTFRSVDTMILQFSRDWGDTYTNIAGGIARDSSIVDTSYNDSTHTDTTFFWKFTDTLTWISPTAPTNGGYLKLMAIDTASDTAYSQAYGPYYVMAPGGNQYATYSNQNLMSANNDADKIGLVYTAQDPDTVTKLSVVYMESDEGLDFSAPDTVGLGRWPSFSEGACFWQNITDPFIYHPDTLFYSYQLNDTFATPYPFMAISPNADSGEFAPVGLTSVNDTVHAIIRVKIATHEGGDIAPTLYYSLVTLYAKFPEALPGSCVMDTLQQMTSTSAAGYNIGDYATSVVKRDSVIYGAYNDAVNCCFATIVPSGNTTTTIGQGSQPSVSCSEGNITYTYLGSGDTSLIRLWRYLDDTTWIERDTFYLEDEVECLSGDRGVLYGVHYKDTSLTDVYGFSPFSEGFLLQGYYTGYYAHPFVDDEANEFSWIAAYADYADSSGYKFLHTVRRPLYVSIPAAYMESDIKRSPFTVYRDTCIHYRPVDVDSGTDSLKYRIPCLDASLDYSLMVQFYHEADSAAELQVTVGSNVDTIEVPTQEFFWFHDTLPSGTDTVNLKIKRLSSSSYTFAPVCRIIVRRRSSEGVYIFSDVEEPLKPQPVPFCLYQPFPNPFSDAATIRYSLPYATHVSLKVYDVSGRLVTRLVDGKVRPGVHELKWSGKDNVNRKCPAGVYFVRFATDQYKASKKMVLIK